MNKLIIAVVGLVVTNVIISSFLVGLIKEKNYYKGIYDSNAKAALEASANPKEIHQKNNTSILYGSVPSTVRVVCS